MQIRVLFDTRNARTICEFMQRFLNESRSVDTRRSLAEAVHKKFSNKLDAMRMLPEDQRDTVSIEATATGWLAVANHLFVAGVFQPAVDIMNGFREAGITVQMDATIPESKPEPNPKPAGRPPPKPARPSPVTRAEKQIRKGKRRKRRTPEQIIADKLEQEEIQRQKAVSKDAARLRKELNEGIHDYGTDDDGRFSPAVRIKPTSTTAGQY